MTPARPKRFYAVDPLGKTHLRPGQERVFSHCVAVRPSYAVAMANASRIPDSLRHRYEFLKSAAKSAVAPVKAGEWYSPEAAAKHEQWFVERAKATLNGARSFDQFAIIAVNENRRRVADLKDEGYYDRWSIASWNISLHEAEQQGFMLRRKEEYAEVVILDVINEW